MFMRASIFGLAIILVSFGQSVRADEPTSTFERIQKITEADLRQELIKIEEVKRLDLPTSIRIAHDYIARGANHYRSDLNYTSLTSARSDLRSLPLQPSFIAKLDKIDTKYLGTLSRKLRVHIQDYMPLDKTGQRPSPVALTRLLNDEKIDGKRCWVRPEAVPTLNQMLMQEEEPMRAMLVELLSSIPGSASTHALAQRAVFDFSPTIRSAAIKALESRTPSDYRKVLIRGLRHPWVPASQHAAEALVSLKDEKSIPELIDLLRQPNPQYPILLGKDRYGSRELVRIHHNTNCLMCHPMALTKDDPCTGVVPDMVVVGTNKNSSPTIVKGMHNYTRNDGTPVSTVRTAPAPPTQTPLLVRADVSYLRQDFSLSVREKNVPEPVRFDYLVQTKPISVKDAEVLKEKYASSDYPQRQAVLFALRYLTGKELGEKTEDWMKLAPENQIDLTALQKAQEFLQSKNLSEELKNLYQDKEGMSMHVLVEMMPYLSMDQQLQTRTALAERMLDWSAPVLRARMQSTHPEWRLAAIETTIRKPNKELKGDLERIIEEEDHPAVIESARKAIAKLKALKK